MSAVLTSRVPRGVKTDSVFEDNSLTTIGDCTSSLQRQYEDPCKMKISRLASSTRHCSSLCQQQHAAAASRTMSRRSSRILAVCGRSITCSCKLRLRLRTKSSLQKGAFQWTKERRVGPRTTRIHAACWHLTLFSSGPPQAENFARRHKECCKMAYSRMAFSSRGPSSPRAAANRRDWHQASWWVMVEQWTAEWPAAARRRRYDHSERSEPEGVMPPSR